MLGGEVDGFDHGANAIAPDVSLAVSEVGAYVIGAPVNRIGSHACVTTGNGEARLLPLGEAGESVTVAFDGAVAVSQAADIDPHGFLVGLDDGTLARIRPDGSVDRIPVAEGQWVDNLVTAPEAGLIACSTGRTVHLLDAAGIRLQSWSDHPSTPAGLCFAPDGASLAVARYNGVTVWDVATGSMVKDCFWRGSHTAVAWSPDGRFIVTATQDRDLHCWRLADGRDYRMRGYPSKIRCLSWTSDSRYVCASGADTVTAWHCGDDGPAGKPPIELGYVFKGTVTQVACHPTELVVAAGYDDGTVLIGDIANGEAMIAKTTGGGMTTSLAWTADGGTLVAGTGDGAVSTMIVATPGADRVIN